MTKSCSVVFNVVKVSKGFDVLGAVDPTIAEVRVASNTIWYRVRVTHSDPCMVAVVECHYRRAGRWCSTRIHGLQAKLVASAAVKFFSDQGREVVA